MSGYEQIPCSVFVHPAGSDTNQIGGEENKAQPTAPTQKNINQNFDRAPLPKKEHPPHPALKKKTVVFGKTANVSQTVEGTSRAVKNLTQKKIMNNSSMVDEISNETEKVLLEHLEDFKKELQDDIIKRFEDMNKENVEKISEMISHAMSMSTLSKNQDPVETPILRKCERSVPVKSEIANIRNVIRTEGRIPPEAIPYFERRLQSDPMFRQRIDDILADEEDERDRETNPDSGLLRESVTVQRSIRYDNGVSFNARQDWNKEKSVPRAEYNKREKWSNHAPVSCVYQDAPVSVYQPVPSISYYPTKDAAKPYYEEKLPDKEPLKNTVRKDDESAKREREKQYIGRNMEENKYL